MKNKIIVVAILITTFFSLSACSKLTKSESTLIKGQWELLQEPTQVTSNLKLLDFPNPVFNECTLHWLSHLQVHSFLHVLSHNYSEEKALQQIEIVVTFLRNGFNSLMEEALLRK